MANTAAFVTSVTLSGTSITLVLGDALTSPANTFTATFPINDAENATGSPVTLITNVLNGNPGH